MNIIYADYNIYHNSIVMQDIFCGLTVQRQRKD